MLAGRKLLLADDSPTIQKVVELTFADEGVEVISFGSGAEALEKLEEIRPDVVLVDAYMPLPSGYEICEYIKQNAELKHIPVMLLVGSFEPFDEAEARRVGADDILTKPFQSIRRLIDRVGGLVSGKQDTDQMPTAELPHVAEEPEPPQMSTDELEITTANTRPLPEGVAPEMFSAHAGPNLSQTAVSDQQSQSEPELPTSDKQMETNNLQTESALESSDVLLDLGDMPAAARSNSAEDFVLDIDLAEGAPVAVAGSGASLAAPAFVEPQISAPASVDWQIETEPSDLMLNRSTGELNAPPTPAPQLDDTLEWMRPSPAAPEARTEPVAVSDTPRKLERVFDDPVTTGPAVAPAAASIGDLMPEQIDAIARRAVEMLSEKVVQQIAWEVVPQLAELMIKRKLEEKEIQSK